MAKSPMPAVFVGHGSPMYVLQPNRYTAAWRELAQSIPRPRAILAVSAHWMTRGTAVTAMAHPPTIHDFGGFPRALHEVQYPAPGDPALARRVQALLAPAAVALDEGWGLDHGTWSILMHAYPAADIPVVQLSLDLTRPPRDHYELARRLSPLRDEGVLILGSGNVVHNLGEARWNEGAPAHPWASRFSDEVRACLAGGRPEALFDYGALGAHATLSVPTPEHLLPLFHVAAQRRPGESFAFPVDGVELGSIGMLSVALGLEADRDG